MEQAQLIQPVSTAERIRSIDAIRGVALLGILLMNIPGFGMYWDVWYSLTVSPHKGPNYFTYEGMMVLFEGTMRGLFSMLFGAGMVLFMQNKKDIPGRPTVAEYYYRRLLWLVFFGLINAYVILWWGDILFFYGFCGMLLFAFRKLNPKWLLLIGFACVSFGIVKKQWGWNETRELRASYVEAIHTKKEGKPLSNDQKAAIAKWEQAEKNIVPDTAAAHEYVGKMHSGYFTIVKTFIPQNSDFETSFLYHEIWDMLAMMFIGMALFGWGFFTNKLRSSTYALWMLAGYGIGIPIGYVLFKQGWLEIYYMGRYTDHWRSSHLVFVEFRRILITIGHASLIMLVFRSGILKWLMRALANVGQMAFSNYLMQSIICTFFFYGYGLGYYNKLQFYQLYYVVGCVWIFQLIFSSVWLHYFRFGPFEWVWRSLTYWKRQPMKKG